MDTRLNEVHLKNHAGCSLRASNIRLGAYVSGLFRLWGNVGVANPEACGLTIHKIPSKSNIIKMCEADQNAVGILHNMMYIQVDGAIDS